MLECRQTHSPYILRMGNVLNFGIRRRSGLAQPDDCFVTRRVIHLLQKSCVLLKILLTVFCGIVRAQIFARLIGVGQVRMQLRSTHDCPSPPGRCPLAPCAAPIPQP